MREAPKIFNFFYLNIDIRHSFHFVGGGFQDTKGVGFPSNYASEFFEFKYKYTIVFKEKLSIDISYLFPFLSVSMLLKASKLQ